MLRISDDCRAAVGAERPECDSPLATLIIDSLVRQMDGELSEDPDRGVTVTFDNGQAGPLSAGKIFLA